jgi:hypothetical protein
MATFSGGREVESVIADRDIDVQDPSTDDPQYKRQIIAGQPVPADLLAAYADATGDKTAKKAVSEPAMNKAQSGPATSK